MMGAPKTTKIIAGGSTKSHCARWRFCCAASSVGIDCTAVATSQRFRGLAGTCGCRMPSFGGARASALAAVRDGIAAALIFASFRRLASR